MLLVVAMNSNVAMLSLTFYTVICYSLNKEFEYLCRTFKYVQFFFFLDSVYKSMKFKFKLGIKIEMLATFF